MSSKKTLDTLVSDIYETISVLNEGKSLNISEEDIQKFGTAMMDVLRSWSTPRDRSDQHNLRMSNVGKPMRQLWYDLKSEEEQTPIAPHVFIKFLYGHMLEEVLLLLAKLSGHSVKGEQKEVNVDGVIGHMDCIIDGEVVDIKTASGFSFKKFKYGTLREDDPFGYMAQLSGYEENEGTNKGGFLALNKLPASTTNKSETSSDKLSITLLSTTSKCSSSVETSFKCEAAKHENKPNLGSPDLLSPLLCHK